MTVPVGAAGVRGLGGRGYLAYTTGGGAVGRGGGSGAPYGLKADKQTEEKLYDLLPGMELTPMTPATMSLKAAGIKPAPQVTCLREGGGLGSVQTTGVYVTSTWMLSPQPQGAGGAVSEE